MSAEGAARAPPPTGTIRTRTNAKKAAKIMRRNCGSFDTGALPSPRRHHAGVIE